MSKENLEQVWEKRASSKIDSDSELNELGIRKGFDKDIIVIWLREIAKEKTKSELKKMKVLDGGCSIGEYLVVAKAAGFGEMHGIDISLSGIKECKKRGFECSVGDVRKLPYPDNTFDIVTSGGVVEHFKDSEKAVSEASRVLKKNGILLIGVPYKYSFFVINKKLQQIFGVWPIGYERSFSRRNFEKILKRNDFKIIKFNKKPVGKGRRLPIVSNIIRTVDKGLGIFGLGGHFINYWCEKKE